AKRCSAATIRSRSPGHSSAPRMSGAGSVLGGSTAPASSISPTGSPASRCRGAPGSRRGRGEPARGGGGGAGGVFPPRRGRPATRVTYGGERAAHVAFWLGPGRILHGTARDRLGVVEEAESAELRGRRRLVVRLPGSPLGPT